MKRTMEKTWDNIKHHDAAWYNSKFIRKFLADITRIIKKTQGRKKAKHFLDLIFVKSNMC